MIATRRRRSIPRSSPFAALRGLPLVGPSLVEQPDDLDPFEIEYLPYQMFPAVDMPKSHAAARYMEHGQGQAAVLGFDTQGSDACLTFGHVDIVRLAHTFIDDAPWHEINRTFPTQLVFQDVRELIVLKQGEQGVYQRLRSPIAADDIARIWAIQAAPGNYHVGLRLYGSRGYSRSKRPPESWYLDNYYIFLACGDIAVEESLREEWIETFDGAHLDVFDRFQSVWPVPRWGVPDFDRWIATGETPEPIGDPKK